MIFILRSEKAPARVVRETDELGISRTFWIWRDGAWVVALRSAEGEIRQACSNALEVEVEPGDNVCIVRVQHPGTDGRQTIPAPAPAAETTDDCMISAVVPVAPKVADLEVIGVHVDPARKAAT